MHDASAAENDAARVVQKLLKRRKSIVKLLVLGKKADPNQWLKRWGEQLMMQGLRLLQWCILELGRLWNTDTVVF